LPHPEPQLSTHSGHPNKLPPVEFQRDFAESE
jgi:hypothetical protein